MGWWSTHRTEVVLPFHSASPYRGRLYRQLDMPGSPPNKTSPLVSLPLHTGCLESGWFLQTAACRAEKTHEFWHNTQFTNIQSTIITSKQTLYTPLTRAQRGTWSGICRWFLSCSLSGRTPWRRQLAAGGPVSCGSGHRIQIQARVFNKEYRSQGLEQQHLLRKLATLEQ